MVLKRIMNYELRITKTNEEFMQTSKDVLKKKIESAIVDHDSCILGLSGGSTPKPIYEALGKENLDWSKVYIFLADERYIAPDHPDSNQGMVRDTLLVHAKIPEENIAFPDISLPIKECIEQYAIRLQGQWADYLPDIIALGLGDDGHITSLFPPVPQDLRDDTKLVAHTTTDAFAVHDRITLTLNPVLSASSHLFFLTEKKKNVWEEMITSTEGEERWPAKAVLEQEDVTVVTHW
jgi:6-phosphogluconolactonase